MRRRDFVVTAASAMTLPALSACAGRAVQGGGLAGALSVKTLDVKAFEAERRLVQTPFGRISYVERGAGPAALFLHGFPLNGFQWRGALERLSGHRRCIVPDLMGLGFSVISSQQSVAPQAQADMLATLLDKLAVASVDLVASDSGGAVAQLFLLKFPQRVRTLLLTNCDVEPDSPPAALLPVLAMAREGKLADEWFAAWVRDKTLARSAQGLGGLTFTYPQRLTDETIDYYLGPLVSSAERKAQVHAYALALDPNPLAGIESALRQSKVRTRVVWGTGDDIFSQASPEYLQSVLPNFAGIRRVNGAKLFFPEEFPDLIAEELLGLWREGAGE